MPDAEQIAVFIPIIALLIPVVAILTKHQKEMAMVIRDTQNQGANNVLPQIMHELQALRTEVSTMKQQLNDVTLAVDDHKTLMARTQEVGGQQ